MPDRGSHLTEALTGKLTAPLDADQRQQTERVKGYLQSVASAYRSLAGQETDPGRQAGYRDQAGRSDAAVQRLGSMAAEERQDILRVAPGLLERLRAEIDR